MYFLEHHCTYQANAGMQSATADGGNDVQTPPGIMKYTRYQKRSCNYSQNEYNKLKGINLILRIIIRRSQERAFSRHALICNSDSEHVFAIACRMIRMKGGISTDDL